MKFLFRLKNLLKPHARPICHGVKIEEVGVEENVVDEDMVDVEELFSLENKLLENLRR